MRFNQKGSILSVAFIIMVVLSFSLTSLTAYTIRTVQNTERTMESNISKNEAKRIISQAMNDFRYGFDDTEGLNDFLNDFDEEENPFDGFGDPDYYIEGELIPELLDRYAADEGDSLLNIKFDETKFDDIEISNDVKAASFKFSYNYDDNRDIVRYLHVTNHGVQYEEFNAFRFTIGTNQNLAINGGEYFTGDGEGEAYGGRILDNHIAVDFNDFSDYGDTFTGNYPAGEPGSMISYNYQRCIESHGCVSINDNSITLNIDEYDGPYSPDNENKDFVSDLFMDFDLEPFYFRKFKDFIDINEVAHEPITQTNYIDELPNIDQFESYNNDDVINEATLHSGDLELDTNETLEVNDILVIDGDLTISSIEELIGDGILFVTGDVYFGTDDSPLNQDVEMSLALFSKGKVSIHFNNDYGLYSETVSDGATLFALDNILIFNSSLERAQGLGNRKNSLFIFTQNSIFVDASNYPFEITGPLYAQGKGDGLDFINIKENDEIIPFKGIYINSYNDGDGFQETNDDGSLPEWNEDEDYEIGDQVLHNGIIYEASKNAAKNQDPSHNSWDEIGSDDGEQINPGSDNLSGYNLTGTSDQHNFKIYPISDAGPPGQEEALRESFNHLPNNFRSLILFPGIYSYETSTFSYETLD